MSILRAAVQIVTSGRRVAPMPSGAQPGSSGDYSILTPANATLSAQEVKEDLPKPTDGRIMVELEEAIRQLRVVRPDASVAGALCQITLSRPADRELLEIALRKVGLPD
ncbi:MAG TPA: hypothetical protein VEP47_13720 [Reyranella sp.]|nr:hypothetical protein [Reyranella sp.]